MSHTYALLEVSPEAFEEIRAKLEAAGYDHAFQEDDGRPVIDMHGIALQHPDECRHGVPIAHGCNGCSDAAAAGGTPDPRGPRRKETR